MTNNYLHKTQYNNFVWIDICQPDWNSLEKIAKEFQQAVKLRTKQKETLSIDIKSTEAEIEKIHVDKSVAEILVRFTSDQIVTTLSKDGEIIDNTNQLTNRMIDRWTFQKDLAETGLAWLLVKTESVEL